MRNVFYNNATEYVKSIDKYIEMVFLRITYIKIKIPS